MGKVIVSSDSVFCLFDATNVISSCRKAARRGSHCCVIEAVGMVKQRSCEIARDEVEMGDVIGEGASGVVFKATWKGKECAAKMVKHGVTADTQEYKDLIRELSMLIRLGSHKNLVSLYGANIEDLHAPIIIEEYMDGPDMETYLGSKHTGFDLGRPTVHRWSAQILSALNFLHDRDPIIMHRDLKPSNILLSKDCKVLKLADFGLAKEISKDERTVIAHASNTGTPRYMAPEVLCQLNMEEDCDASRGHAAAYTEKADIYSASLIIWYMLTGTKPCVNIKADPFQRPNMAMSRRRWPELSELLEKMWCHQPEQRPSAGNCFDYLEDMSAAAFGRQCSMRYLCTSSFRGAVTPL